MASSSSLVDLSLKRVSIIPLQEEEELAVSYEGPLIDEAEVDTRWSIVGRFLMDTPIDYMVMQNLMVVLWKPGMGMYVKELGGNKYIFQFYHETDIQRVMDMSPWTFKNSPCIFERLKPGDVPREVPLHHLDIWVQLHDIRSGFKTERVVWDAGKYIGGFIKSDENNFNGFWRDYLRVQVRLNIEKPLKHRMKLQQIGGDWFWIKFHYKFAMSRRNQYAIGAKWLRSRAPSSSNVGGTMVVEARQSAMSAGTNFQGSVGGVNLIVMNHGVNRGLIFSPIVLSDNNGSKGWEALGDGNSNLEEDEMVFLDSKHKRTDKEVSIRRVGPKEGVDVSSRRVFRFENAWLRDSN
ncbi:hypothetical protein F8388_023459 [Cannabis sativa]|uniref:DUF4283 domain-containing protein n=1 Tax=Cannabis sativa TaxID=3483 RepID=A0A7J6FN62_CANSA|nr:hypothetical protein F8388_023459 [Cannabis sativa]